MVRRGRGRKCPEPERMEYPIFDAASDKVMAGLLHLEAGGIDGGPSFTTRPHLAENDQASGLELADSARERRSEMGC